MDTPGVLRFIWRYKFHIATFLILVSVPLLFEVKSPRTDLDDIGRKINTQRGVFPIIVVNDDNWTRIESRKGNESSETFQDPNETVNTSVVYTVPEDSNSSSLQNNTTLTNTGDPEVTSSVPRGERLNVLFLLADDLRPQLGSYRGRDYVVSGSQHQMMTPHIDALADRSLVLKRAYAQYSLCGPSRASMMTSRRPDVTKVYRNYVNWRASGNFTSIPQYFKDNGYVTLGTGKIFHVDNQQASRDVALWSEPFHVVDNAVDEEDVNWLAVADRYVLDDERRVQHVIQRLSHLAAGARTGEQPFFAAIGFRRPHAPHVCPEQFYKLYPLEKGDYLSNRTWQTPQLSVHTRVSDAPLPTTDTRRMSALTLREIRRGYFACVSYVDDLIGDLLETLDVLDLTSSTVVVLTTDDGLHLGENDFYGAYTTREVALHVPLIIHVPGRTDRGVETRSLVELVDVFPTVVEAAGLSGLDPCPVRSSFISTCTDGVSLLPLVESPQRVLKEAAYSQVSRGADMAEVTVRTERFRYTDLARYTRSASRSGRFTHMISWNISLEYMSRERTLFDLNLDPEEKVNVYGDPDYAESVKDLKQRLQEHFKSIYDYPDDVYDMYV